MALLKIGQAAEYLGCNVQTLRNYCSKGLLPEKRNAANHRIFDTDDLDALITTVSKGNNPLLSKKTAFYVRSSEGNKNHLANQIEQLRTGFGEPDHIIKDSGSGLNENRKGLAHLIELVENKEVNTVYVTNKDRLTRFGCSYIEKLFSTYNVEIKCLYTKDLTPHEELMQDFMSLIASFSGKFYQLRSKENKKKLLNEAMKKVD